MNNQLFYYLHQPLFFDTIMRKRGSAAMRCDYHVHSAFSDDSVYPMEEVVKKAVSLGLDEICFCEHTDFGMKPNQICDYPAFFAEIKRCQELYQHQLTIKAGAEFGMQVHTIPEFEKVYHSHTFDFVLLSCHQVDNKEFWNQDFQSGKTQEQYNNAYYEEIYQVMKRYHNYSVLAHLDAIKRDDRCGIYPFVKSKHQIEKILRLAIQEQKGIEVNTSSFRYGLSDLTPCREILSLYYELGGRIITLGSDSHKEEHLAAHFDEVIAALKSIGYREYCTFDKMRPIFHPLP